MKAGDTTGKGTIHALQIYRGMAALAVLLYHATMLVDEHYHHASLGGVFGAGFGGVHVFFVLSGFIMLLVHVQDLDRPKRLVTFVKKRFTRIYPLYWAVLLPSALFYYLYLGRPLEIHHFIGNLLLTKLSRFEAIVPVAWTLFHEILFYSLFAILILKFRLGVVAFAAWIALVIPVGYFGLNLSPPYLLTTLTGLDYGAISAFFLLTTSSLNSLFLFGLAAYGLYHLLKRHPARETVGLSAFFAGILLVLALGANYNANHPVGDYSWSHLHHLTLGFGLAAMLLMTAAASETLERWFSRQKALLFLGNASYSIYLTHYLLQKELTSHLPFLLPKRDPESALLAFLITVACTLLVGILVYRYVEVPLMTWTRARLRSRTGRVSKPVKT